jgi:hypothetical protein
MPEEEPIIDLHSDDHFMREALRQRARTRLMRCRWERWWFRVAASLRETSTGWSR